ncbi:TraX family protein [Pseudomonas sp. NPDC089554]|uniref:TraX family protein n=1 Tax=Pseudomonas sp. NPDC089554 TaxID=3390653 RepID=UPI003D0396F7
MSRRSAGLDLVKWTAMATMLADHLRFLWPATDSLFVLGRLAFPLFCLAIACNVLRSMPGTLFNRANARYLGLMLLFSLLSEGPYRWLDSGSQTLSVMPTLTLGLLLAWAVHHPQTLARVAGVGVLALAALCSERLMYGLPGVLLPAACLLALQQGGRGWLLAAALAMSGNLTNSWLFGHLSQPFTWLVLVTAALALPLGKGLLGCDGWRVPPVGRWGYGFYPLHLLAIKGLLLM